MSLKVRIQTMQPHPHSASKSILEILTEGKGLPRNLGLCLHKPTNESKDNFLHNVCLIHI